MSLAILQKTVKAYKAIYIYRRKNKWWPHPNSEIYLAVSKMLLYLLTFLLKAHRQSKETGIITMPCSMSIWHTTSAFWGVLSVSLLQPRFSPTQAAGVYSASCRHERAQGKKAHWWFCGTSWAWLLTQISSPHWLAVCWFSLILLNLMHLLHG